MDDDNLPVLSGVHVLETQAPNPLLPAAAVAAGGFVAGAATVAVIRRARGGPSRRQRKKARRSATQTSTTARERSGSYDRCTSTYAGSTVGPRRTDIHFCARRTASFIPSG